MLYEGRTPGPQAPGCHSAPASTLPPVARLARSRADKDLDPDDGDEGGSVSWTDNTGMLSTTYCSLLVSLWDQLSITDRKTGPQGFGTCQSDTACQCRFAHMKLVWSSFWPPSCFLPEVRVYLNPASWSLFCSRSLEEYTQRQVERCPRYRDHGLDGGLLCSLRWVFSLSRGVGDSRS